MTNTFGWLFSRQYGDQHPQTFVKNDKPTFPLVDGLVVHPVPVGVVKGDFKAALEQATWADDHRWLLAVYVCQHEDSLTILWARPIEKFIHDYMIQVAFNLLGHSDLPAPFRQRLTRILQEKMGGNETMILKLWREFDETVAPVGSEYLIATVKAASQMCPRDCALESLDLMTRGQQKAFVAELQRFVGQWVLDAPPAKHVVKREEENNE